VAPGYDAARLLKLRTSLRGDDFQTAAARIAHFDELGRRLQALPGVSAASGISFEPPIVTGAGVFGNVRLALPGVPDDAASAPSAVARAVLPDYFTTVGMPQLAGRGVTRDDTPAGQRVAVISQAMARRYFDGVDPIGRSFSVVGPGAQPLVIVGVVGDVMTAGADPSPQPVFYVPYTQSAQPVMSMVVRVAQGDPSALAQAAEQVAWSLSRSCNVYAVETLDRRIADLNWRARFGALLLGGFSALALLLGAAGIYAVISYNVSQRRREIGVRMALGARARDVLAMVLGGGLRLSLYGIVLGGLLSSALTRLLAGSLYGVAPGDPATLAAVSGLLLLVAAGACLVPALRASRVDPLSSLRG
jgi:putative ABC transport system permease protein